MAMLADFLDSIVSVLTNDGRQLVGTLKGVDQVTNVILDDCHERVYGDDGLEQVPLGLFIVRGDNVAVVGEIDADLEEKTDFSLIRGAEMLDPVKH